MHLSWSEDAISDSTFRCQNQMLVNSPIENRVIFCFWTGTNPMSRQRARCLKALRTYTRCNVLLITPSNLSEYILPEAPLHAAYPYLSEVHKADYLRTYFMHFYGGGYADIKIPRANWTKAFKDMKDTPTCLINGYHEASPNSIGYPPTQDLWDRLVGNCAYIVRPRTKFTYAWYEDTIHLLDIKLEELKQHPSSHTRDCSELGTGYPIEWNELLGRIFHKHLASYLDNVLYTVPTPLFKNYQ